MNALFFFVRIANICLNRSCSKLCVTWKWLITHRITLLNQTYSVSAVFSRCCVQKVFSQVLSRFYTVRVTNCCSFSFFFFFNATYLNYAIYFMMRCSSKNINKFLVDFLQYCQTPIVWTRTYIQFEYAEI